MREKKLFYSYYEIIKLSNKSIVVSYPPSPANHLQYCVELVTQLS